MSRVQSDRIPPYLEAFSGPGRAEMLPGAAFRWILRVQVTTVTGSICGGLPAVLAWRPALPAAASIAAFLARASRVDHQAAVLEVSAVHRLDSALRLVSVWHLDKAETAWLAGDLVLDQRHRSDLPVLAEGLADFVFGRVVREISDVNIHSSALFFCYVGCIEDESY